MAEALVVPSFPANRGGGQDDPQGDRQNMPSGTLSFAIWPGARPARRRVGRATANAAIQWGPGPSVQHFIGRGALHVRLV
jgi:hypothetical protein